MFIADLLPFVVESVVGGDGLLSVLGGESGAADFSGAAGVSGTGFSGVAGFSVLWGPSTRLRLIRLRYFRYFWREASCIFRLFSLQQRLAFVWLRFPERALLAWRRGRRPGLGPFYRCRTIGLAAR